MGSIFSQITKCLLERNGANLQSRNSFSYGKSTQKCWILYWKLKVKKRILPFLEKPTFCYLPLNFESKSVLIKDELLFEFKQEEPDAF